MDEVKSYIDRMVEAAEQNYRDRQWEGAFTNDPSASPEALSVAAWHLHLARKIERGEDSPGEWHPVLRCHLRWVVIDYALRTVGYHVQQGECVDMSGATSLAERWDPMCDRVYTWSGNRPDAAYMRVDGEWVVVTVH